MDPKAVLRWGGDADFGTPAELIGHPARSTMLLALLDGRALPISMLACEAGVAASTASGHLARLVQGGLPEVRQEGRHRYYELASSEVVVALEALARSAPPRPVSSLRAGTRARALESLLPPALVRHGPFTGANLVAGAMNLVGIDTVFVATLYLQNVQHHSAFIAGVML